jgi:hypothetical protein
VSPPHGPPDGSERTIHVGEHVPRREADHQNALPVQPAGSALVMGDAIRVIVTLAIDLDGQPKLVTVEVEDVGPDRVLSPEAQAPCGAMPATSGPLAG